MRQAASRKWLQIDAQGKLAYVTVDKHTLVLRLNIPYRDLRSLEYSVRRPLLGVMEREHQAQALASAVGRQQSRRCCIYATYYFKWL